MTPDMVRHRPVYRPSPWVIAWCVVVIYGIGLLTGAWDKGFWPFGG